MPVAALDFVITHLIASNKPPTDDDVDDLSVILCCFILAGDFYIYFASIWPYSKCGEIWLHFPAAWQRNMKYMSAVKYEVKNNV